MSLHENENDVIPFAMEGVYSDRDWHQIVVGTVIVVLAVMSGLWLHSLVAIALAVASLACAYFGASTEGRAIYVGLWIACVGFAVASWLWIALALIWS